MEQTITPNGALFGAAQQEQRVNGRASKHKALPVLTFRTTVGEFALRRSQTGYQLEVKVGKLGRLLGVHQTTEAAVIALTNRRTGFKPWDLIGRHGADIQIDTSQRWNRTF